MAGPFYRKTQIAIEGVESVKDVTSVVTPLSTIETRSTTTSTLFNEYLERLTESDRFDGKRFSGVGHQTVAIDGNFAIVGAPFDDVNGIGSGSVYIYRRTGDNTWGGEFKITPSDGQANDQFGRSVAIDGDYIIVGAPFDDDNGTQFGSVYIYRRTGGNVWGNEFKILATDGSDSDYFGDSVSISGDYAIVGAWREDSGGSDSGSVYIYERVDPDNVWVEFQKISSSTPASSHFFGSSVSIDGDYAVVGAFGPPTTDSGSVFVFKKGESGNWLEKQKIIPSDGQIGDRFGGSVSIDGDYIIVGALGRVEDSGSAYVYHRFGVDIWGEEYKMKASDASDYDLFGISVSIDGDYAVVGAPFNDNSSPNSNYNSGSAYIFKRTDFNNWIENSKIKSDQGYEVLEGNVGSSVSISGTHSIISAFGEENESGAVYFFFFKETQIFQQFYEESLDFSSEIGNMLITANGNDGLSLLSYDENGYVLDFSFKPPLFSRDNVSVVEGIDANGNFDTPFHYPHVVAGGSSNLFDIYRVYPDGYFTGSNEFILSDFTSPNSYYGQSVSVDGINLIVGSYGNNSVHFYVRGGENNWVFINSVDFVYEGFSLFGWSVDISGDYAVVGDYKNNIVYVYKKNQNINVWEEMQTIQPSSGSPSRFGWSVAIDGETIVVGDDGGKKVYVYKNISESWSDEFLISPSSDNNRFGFSVDINDDQIIVGGNSGYVYVYSRVSSNLNSWSEDQKISGSEPSNLFGVDVAISNDFLIIGDTSDGVGKAFVYDNAYGFWANSVQFSSPNPSSSGFFGSSVDIEGKLAVVGEHYFDSSLEDNSGKAYVYAFGENNWDLKIELVASDKTFNDDFGRSVKISGDHIAVGAPWKNLYSGQVYVYQIADIFFELVASTIETKDLNAIDVYEDGANIEIFCVLKTDNYLDNALTKYTFNRQTLELSNDWTVSIPIGKSLDLYGYISGTSQYFNVISMVDKGTGNRVVITASSSFGVQMFDASSGVLLDEIFNFGFLGNGNLLEFVWDIGKGAKDEDIYTVSNHFDMNLNDHIPKSVITRYKIFNGFDKNSARTIVLNEFSTNLVSGVVNSSLTDGFVLGSRSNVNEELDREMFLWRDLGTYDSPFVDACDELETFDIPCSDNIPSLAEGEFRPNGLMPKGGFGTTITTTTKTTTITTKPPLSLADTIVYDNVPIDNGVVDSITGNPHTIPSFWKSSNSDIDELQIGNTCTSIRNGAFYKCNQLTGSLTIPDSVTFIGDNAFLNCSGFNGSLTIGNSVTYIGIEAFENCSGFTGSLTIPNSVTNIGGYAFRNCDGFTSLTIGNSVTTIGSLAFYFCDGFTGSLTIPNSVTTIGDFAFYRCNSLTGSLTIGNSVTTIGTAAFYLCTNFTGSLTIPDSVTSIEGGAFFSCTGLTGTLTILSSVTTIGSQAFAYCTRLTVANIATSRAKIEGIPFQGSGITCIYAKDAEANGWTIGPGQSIGGKGGIEVFDWTNYPTPNTDCDGVPESSSSSSQSSSSQSSSSQSSISSESSSSQSSDSSLSSVSSESSSSSSSSLSSISSDGPYFGNYFYDGPDDDFIP